jgi:hypothetical protein
MRNETPERTRAGDENFHQATMALVPPDVGVAISTGAVPMLRMKREASR